MQSSRDGGVTWSGPVLFPVDAELRLAGSPTVVRPNGELVIVFFEDGVVRAIALERRRRDVLPASAMAALTIPHERPITAEPAARLQPARRRASSAGTVYAAWPTAASARAAAPTTSSGRGRRGPGSWTSAAPDPARSAAGADAVHAARPCGRPSVARRAHTARAELLALNFAELHREHVPPRRLRRDLADGGRPLDEAAPRQPRGGCGSPGSPGRTAGGWSATTRERFLRPASRQRPRPGAPACGGSFNEATYAYSPDAALAGT